MLRLEVHHLRSGSVGKAAYSTIELQTRTVCLSCRYCQYYQGVWERTKIYVCIYHKRFACKVGKLGEAAGICSTIKDLDGCFLTGLISPCNDAF